MNSITCSSSSPVSSSSSCNSCIVIDSDSDENDGFLSSSFSENNTNKTNNNNDDDDDDDDEEEMMKLAPFHSTKSGSTSTSTTNSNSKNKSKNKGFITKNKSSCTSPQEEQDKTSTKISSSCKSNYFHCYLLRSLDPKHPYKTYIGFTTDPHRRIRQHNGILQNGGAYRTRRSGRPWTFALIIGGFADKLSALRFEWAWQHPSKSKCIRNSLLTSSVDANDDDDDDDNESTENIDAVSVMAKVNKMARTRGVKAKLEILKVLLYGRSSPFRCHALDLYFFEEKYQQLFLEVLLEDKKEGGRLIALHPANGLNFAAADNNSDDYGKQHHCDNNASNSTFSEKGTIDCDIRLLLPPAVKCSFVSSYELMPFWKDKENKRKRRHQPSSYIHRLNNDGENHSNVSDNTKKSSTSSSLSSQFNIATISNNIDRCSLCHPAAKTNSTNDNIASSSIPSAANMTTLPQQRQREKSKEENEVPVKCRTCNDTFHVICLADFILDAVGAPSSALLPTEGPCPSCGNNIIWSRVMADRRKLLISSSSASCENEQRRHFHRQLLSHKDNNDSSHDNGGCDASTSEGNKNVNQHLQLLSDCEEDEDEDDDIYCIDSNLSPIEDKEDIAGDKALSSHEIFSSSNTLRQKNQYAESNVICLFESSSRDSDQQDNCSNNGAEEITNSNSLLTRTQNNSSDDSSYSDSNICYLGESMRADTKRNTSLNSDDESDNNQSSPRIENSSDITIVDISSPSPHAATIRSCASQEERSRKSLATSEAFHHERNSAPPLFCEYSSPDVASNPLRNQSMPSDSKNHFIMHTVSPRSDDDISTSFAPTNDVIDLCN